MVAARFWQLGVGNEHGVVASRVGDDPSEFPPRKSGPPPSLRWASRMRSLRSGLEVLAALLLAEAAGDEDDRVGPVVLDEVVDDRGTWSAPTATTKRSTLWADQSTLATHGDAVDLARGRMDDWTLS